MEAGKQNIHEFLEVYVPKEGSLICTSMSDLQIRLFNIPEYPAFRIFLPMALFSIYKACAIPVFIIMPYDLNSILFPLCGFSNFTRSPKSQGELVDFVVTVVTGTVVGKRGTGTYQ